MSVPCPYLYMVVHKQPATYTLTGLREPETLLGLFAPAMNHAKVLDGKTIYWNTSLWRIVLVKRCKHSL